jgi:hypothetical protein
VTDPRVINLSREPIGDAVYIGRAAPRRGLIESPFHNPFVVGVDGTRGEVLARYRQHLRDHPELIERIREELADAPALACWCDPKPCHGHIIAAVLRGEEP